MGSGRSVLGHLICPYPFDSGRRLDKAQRGNLGDVKPVGEGVFEMREHFGPGWRMYYVKRGKILIVMLGGGDKGSQERDIAKAKQREATLED